MATPLAPPDTRTIAHLKLDTRGSWKLNGEQGWYVGPVLEHYWCVNIYFPKTRASRICDTVAFLSSVVPFPEVRITDLLYQAASDIIDILTNPPSTTTPSLAAGDPTRNALLKLATELRQVDKLPTPEKATGNLKKGYEQLTPSSPPIPASSPRVHQQQSPRVREKSSPRVLSDHSTPSKKFAKPCITSTKGITEASIPTSTLLRQRTLSITTIVDSH